MITTSITKNSFFILLILLFSSCSESLNFSQVEDFTTSPSVALPITFFEISATNFITDPLAPPITEVSEETGFEFLQNELIKKNLVKIDWRFEIDNSFSRDFTIGISLLNSNGQVIQDLEPMEVRANSLNLPDIETISVDANSNIRNISRLRITISLDNPSRTISSTESGKLNFKSALTFHLKTSF